MSDLLLYSLPGIGLGCVLGWIARGWLSDAQTQLQEVDTLTGTYTRCLCTVVTGGAVVRNPRCPVHTAWTYCPRCSRTDGSHTTDCERARLDQLVAPLRGKRFSARSRGYAGADGQDLPQSSKRVK